MKYIVILLSMLILSFQLNALTVEESQKIRANVHNSKQTNQTIRDNKEIVNTRVNGATTKNKGVDRKPNGTVKTKRISPAAKASLQRKANMVKTNKASTRQAQGIKHSANKQKKNAAGKLKGQQIRAGQESQAAQDKRIAKQKKHRKKQEEKKRRKKQKR